MDLSTSKGSSYSGPRFKNLFMLVMTAGTLIFLVLNVDIRCYIQNKRGYLKRRHSEEYFDNSSTIHTEGCRIPLMTMDDDEIRKMEDSVDNMTQCTPYPLLDSNKTHIWIRQENLLHYNVSSSRTCVCCYKSFYRPKSVDDITASDIDDRVKYNKCRNFSDTIKVQDEFVRVICRDGKKLFDSFFVFAREKKLKPKLNKSLPYNILILGIDGISRLNMHRTMPKTVRCLKELGAVELLGYNKVADNTMPNLMPLLLGRTDTELEETCFPSKRSTFDSCHFIWEQAKKAGFVTAFGEDSASLGTFNYMGRGFVRTPTDYYLHTFIHEAEYRVGSNRISTAKLCMNEKFFFKLFLDYVEDLTTTLKRKLFGFFWEVTMTHDNLNFPMVMDDSYSEFFSRMHTSGYLKETIIFLMSDHGVRWGIFRSTRQGFLEDRLPLVMALLPPSFRNNFNKAYNNFKLNSYRLTTPFDMHATLTDLMNLENITNEKISNRSKEVFFDRGISLFLPIPGNRTCKIAAIDDHWCACYRNTRIESNSSIAEDAVQHVVSHLNVIVKDYPQCAMLNLVKVLEVNRLLFDSFFDDENLEEIKNDSIEVTVVLQTDPGGGVFEATLGRERPYGPWSLSGSVSRLNLYGNQSYCAPTPQLKLYCYCINQMQ